MNFKIKMVVAATSLIMSSHLLASPQNNDDWLHVEGNKVVDMQGQQVWLTGANWFGLNASERVLHGLWSVNLGDTLKTISERGINILRLPISTELMYEWSQGKTTLPNVNTASNPDLVGKTDLQIFDILLATAKKYGIKILLDAHSAKADNSGHVETMWYKGEITSEIFYSSWEWITARYQDDDTILAMDIENEPHGTPYGDTNFAKWDDSTDENNWKYACETASNRILAINPNLIVMCEGIQSYPIDGENWTSQDKNDYHNNWWGGNLRGVRDHPINLGANQDQLMYSPHDYGPLVFLQDWFYEGFNKDTLYQDVWKDNWMFIHEENIAPLLIGEWGGFMDGGDNEKWMLAIRDLIIEHELHHTFWCINPNSGDTGGLLKNDWVTWDEEKYTLFEPTLWKDDKGQFIGLDHQVTLGGEGHGTNVAEYYASLSPSLSISSPATNANVLTKSEVVINYDKNKLDSVNAYIDAQLVATSETGSITVQAPTTPSSFVVQLIGLDNGELTEVSDTISLNALDVLPASIEITSPSNGESFEQGKNLMVSANFTNAAGFKAHFAGETQIILNGSDAIFAVGTELGTHSVTVTAIDSNQQELTLASSVDISVISPTVSCSLGRQNIWPGGFVLDGILIANSGSETVSNWSADLIFANQVVLGNGWSANYTQIDNHTIQISGANHTQSIAPGQTHSIGFQGSYPASFALPECVIK
ncbi:cellulase family glycosylhydrolase [Shewanella violacea]|uniref:cellulase n=1 Tax=Shewanella violacea (strain JCM 10179 / CIP 106290 / LMG 19151 / DSS12) TaxID=637905 RepID=D4ZGP7_SHEVD|nr:cellulase family glycosylhydrolase [Shewanella violacea]BAJ00846.1 cellulase [Shewanella violacea DSS12]